MKIRSVAKNSQKKGAFICLHVYYSNVVCDFITMFERCKSRIGSFWLDVSRVVPQKPVRCVKSLGVSDSCGTIWWFPEIGVPPNHR